MITPISILQIAGVVFLFLAAFSINFGRIVSGWMGLALIFFATLLPLFGLSTNVLLVIVAILLIIVIVILLTDRYRRPPA